MLKIYTDGGCIGNGKPDAVGGIGVYVEGHPEMCVSERLRTPPAATNQRAELTGIIRALQFAKKQPCIIYTDSMYCYNGTTIWMQLWAKNNGRLPQKKL